MGCAQGAEVGEYRDSLVPIGDEETDCVLKFGAAILALGSSLRNAPSRNAYEIIWVIGQYAS